MKTLIFKMSKLMAIILLASVTFTACEKNDTDSSTPNNSNTSKSKYLFQIENGAQSVTMSDDDGKRSVGMEAYSAIILDENLNIITVNPTWSVDDTDVASISSDGSISINAAGIANITASVEYEGLTFTASVPLNIQMPALFAVAPSAILDFENEDIQLEPVYFSATGQTATYTYSSSDNSIASVDANGLVSCESNGNCIITITSNIQSNPSVTVPVMVIGMPDVVLPVTKVTLNQSATDLLKTETFQFSAKAFNPEGELTGKTFSWTSINSNIASISENGLVTPVSSGTTYIKATCDGVFATAEVMVLPDTIVIVTPFYVEVEAGQSLQFEAKAYKTSRAGLIQEYNVDFEWIVPDYGPGFEMFNIGTIDQAGMFSMKQDAMMGNATFVIATDPDNISATGAAMVMVDMGIGF